MRTLLLVLAVGSAALVACNGDRFHPDYGGSGGDSNEGGAGSGAFMSSASSSATTGTTIPTGSPCDSDGDCPDGICNSKLNQCVGKGALGTPCYQDEECLSTVCNSKLEVCIQAAAVVACKQHGHHHHHDGEDEADEDARESSEAMTEPVVIAPTEPAAIVELALPSSIGCEKHHEHDDEAED